VSLPPDSAADRTPPVAIDRVAAFVEEYDLKQAVGGVRGLVDSGLASTAFVAVYALGGRRLAPALWAALGVTVALLVVRAVRREPLRQALSGVLAVGLSALIAVVTGRAANFFVVGIVIQVLYAAAYLVSLAVRWPLMGVIVGPMVGEGMAWRSDPPRRRAYWWCSWIWFAVFVFRTAVQVPLYLQDKVVTLGIVKIAMGWPLFALAGLASWLILRRVPPTLPVTATDPDPSGVDDEVDPANELYLDDLKDLEDVDDVDDLDDAVGEEGAVSPSAG
jgi:Protein of unknown function (DUF3159)